MHFRAAGLTPLKKLGKVLGGKAHIFCAIKYFFGYIYWKCPMNYLKVKSVPIYIFIIVYILYSIINSDIVQEVLAYCCFAIVEPFLNRSKILAF